MRHDVAAFAAGFLIGVAAFVVGYVAGVTLS